MKCVTEWYVCCFMLFSFLLRRFVSGSCFYTPVGRCQIFFFAVDSASFSIRYSVFTFSNYIQFCSFKLFKLTVLSLFTCTQCCWPYTPVGSKSTCPLCTLPLFTSSLIIVPSRLFRTCEFFSSSTTMVPARATFCLAMRGLTTLVLLNVVHL